MAPRDLLLQLSWEHRDLTVVARGLRRGVPDLDAEVIGEALVRLVDHELAHRLLVHPLLRRDDRGRLLLAERREEQLVLADRIQHVLIAADITPGGATAAGSTGGLAAGVDDLEVLFDLHEVVTHLDDQFAEHADREEILAFPHLRRLATVEELAELGELRARLGEVVRPLLTVDGPLIAAGRWASAPRRRLAELLELPADVVAALPAPSSREPARS